MGGARVEEAGRQAREFGIYFRDAEGMPRVFMWRKGLMGWTGLRAGSTAGGGGILTLQYKARLGCLSSSPPRRSHPLNSKLLLLFFFGLFSFKVFIYLPVLSLMLKHAGSSVFVMARRIIFSGGMWDLVPQPGIESGS